MTAYIRDNPPKPKDMDADNLTVILSRPYCPDCLGKPGLKCDICKGGGYTFGLIWEEVVTVTNDTIKGGTVANTP